MHYRFKFGLIWSMVTKIVITLQMNGRGNWHDQEQVHLATWIKILKLFVKFLCPTIP